MAPSAHSGAECFGGLAEQDDVEFSRTGRAYRPGRRRRISPPRAVGQVAHLPAAQCVACISATQLLYLRSYFVLHCHLLHLTILLFEGGST